MNCFCGRLNVGKVKLISIHVYAKMQFIDYIYGGCDISAMVAMDCTIGNGPPSKKTSLHYMPELEAMSQNQTAITGPKARILRNFRLKNCYMQRMVDEAEGIATKKVDEDGIIPFNEYQEALYLCMSVLKAFDND